MIIFILNEAILHQISLSIFKDSFPHEGEDGGSMAHQNVRIQQHHYMVS